MGQHTCAPPGDSAEDILNVAYDLRCAGCVDMLVSLQGPMLPAAAFDARATVERETVARVVAKVERDLARVQAFIDCRPDPETTRYSIGQRDAYAVLLEELRGAWKGGE